MSDTAESPSWTTRSSKTSRSPPSIPITPIPIGAEVSISPRYFDNQIVNNTTEVKESKPINKNIKSLTISTTATQQGSKVSPSVSEKTKIPLPIIEIKTEVFSSPEEIIINPLRVAMANNDDIQSVVEKRIPLFYGQVDVDPSEVHYFLDACKRIQAIYRTDNEKLKTALEEIILRLRGKAYQTLRDTPVTKFNDFYSTITQNFLPKYSLELLSERLHSAKQNRLESCTQFGQRVIGLALDYDAGVKTKYGETNALPKPLISSMEQEAFVRGLKNPTIKASIAVALNKTTKELIQMAETLELKLTPSNDFVHPFNESRTQVIECQLCNIVGHQAKECPTLKGSAFPAKMTSQLQQPGAPQNKSCKYCKKYGHEIHECRKKRKADEWRSKPSAHYQDRQVNQDVEVIPKTPLNQQNYNPQRYASHNWNYGPTQIPHQQYQPPQRFSFTHSNQPVYPVGNWQVKPQHKVTFQRGTPYNSSPKKNQYSRGNQSLEEDMQKLSIKYIDDEKINVDENQGNHNGLADME